MTPGYGTLCTEVYELDKPIGHSFGDVEYYKRLLAGVRGRILEPAVGTGRILIPLLEAGFDVAGFDTSPAMLAACRRHCRERNLDPVLCEADMTRYVQPSAYAAVIIPAGSIMLLHGRDATFQALRCFWECLQPSGRLLVDVDVPPTHRRGEPSPGPIRYWRRGPFVWTLQTQHSAYDPAANQATNWDRYEKWHAGTLVATELQLFRLQYWGIDDFVGMVKEAGLTEVSITADYLEGHAPEVESHIWTFHASRPPRQDHAVSPTT